MRPLQVKRTACLAPWSLVGKVKQEVLRVVLGRIANIANYPARADDPSKNDGWKSRLKDLIRPGALKTDRPILISDVPKQFERWFKFAVAADIFFYVSFALMLIFSGAAVVSKLLFLGGLPSTILLVIITGAFVPTIFFAFGGAVATVFMREQKGRQWAAQIAMLRHKYRRFINDKTTDYVPSGLRRILLGVRRGLYAVCAYFASALMNGYTLVSRPEGWEKKQAEVTANYELNDAEKWFESVAAKLSQTQAGGFYDEAFIADFDSRARAYLAGIMDKEWETYNEPRLKLCAQLITIVLWRAYPMLFDGNRKVFLEVLDFARRHPCVVRDYDNADSEGQFGSDFLRGNTGTIVLGTIAHELGHNIFEKLIGKSRYSHMIWFLSTRAFSEGFMGENTMACFYRLFMSQEQVKDTVCGARRGYYGNIHNEEHLIGITQLIALLLDGYEPEEIARAVNAMFREWKNERSWHWGDKKGIGDLFLFGRYGRILSPDDILLLEAA